MVERSRLSAIDFDVCRRAVLEKDREMTAASIALALVSYIPRPIVVAVQRDSETGEDVSIAPLR
ncbi:MAG TPA: hypothetical protein VJV39_15150, partial [Dongiaceae bacterium]|nr:hypothetical protein [Dongiaceae bacterium]